MRQEPLVAEWLRSQQSETVQVHSLWSSSSSTPHTVTDSPEVYCTAHPRPAGGGSMAVDYGSETRADSSHTVWE